MSNQLLEVLYEDNHLIAINKSPSDIVQGDKTGDKPLNEIVKDFLKQKYQKPGDVFVGTVHRIDRPVSGVLLFAKTSKALTRLNKMFQTKEIQKTYWAVVKKTPPKEEGTLINYLIKNEAKNISRTVSENVKGALRCELDYKIIGKLKTLTLLEINPHTGRHHQIRVQLAAIGSPIKGDLKYGFARSNEDASIHLHARKISFIHPVKKELLEIIAAPPNEIVWNDCLKIHSQQAK
jgi:23S rRNA pseudouridine1911/1915/1917 synthase